MEAEDSLEEFKNEAKGRLEKRFPGFEKEWKNIVKSLGTDFVNMMRKQLTDEVSLFSEISEFQLTVVIDNNFIFGQIKNAVEKGKPIKNSFIHKLVKCKFVNVCAPHKLKEELFDKLETVLKKDNELGREYANLLLDDITIKDAYWIEDWKKATNLIGHTDRDDVPYLALAIHTQSHAIISNDKVFKQQTSSKAWSIHETDEVITSYSSGFMSFCFVGAVPHILHLLWQVIVAFFKIIGEIIWGILKGIGLIIVGAVELLAQLPQELLWIIGGAMLVSLLFSENARQFGKDTLIQLGKFAQGIIDKVSQFIQWLTELLKELWEVIKPIAEIGFEFLAYFTAEYQLMEQKVQQLENDRAK